MVWRFGHKRVLLCRWKRYAAWIRFGEIILSFRRPTVRKFMKISNPRMVPKRSAFLRHLSNAKAKTKVKPNHHPKTCFFTFFGLFRSQRPVLKKHVLGEVARLPQLFGTPQAPRRLPGRTNGCSAAGRRARHALGGSRPVNPAVWTKTEDTEGLRYPTVHKRIPENQHPPSSQVSL